MVDENNIDYDKEEKVLFNFGVFKVRFMASLIANSQNAFVRGDIIQWYNYLRAIKNLIKPRLSIDELSKFNKVENIIGKMLSVKKKNPDGTENIEKHNQIVVKSCYKYIDLYDTMLSEILDMKGYGDQIRDDQTSLFEGD